MSLPHMPGPPATPPPCMECGEPSTRLLYLWFVRTRWGVFGIGAPFSVHMRPKAGRMLEWAGLCQRHRKRRLFAAVGVISVAYVITLPLWGVAFFAVDLKTSPVLAAGLFLTGALIFMFAMCAGLWLLIVLRVPSDDSRVTWASRGGAGHFPVEPERER